MTASRTSWTRLWCTYRAEDIRAGLAARVADPLWLLSRQWQFGEFQGDDAAAPAKATIAHATLRTSVVSDGAAPEASRSATLGATDLLEPFVEAEDVENGPAALRLAGEAGVQFLRLIPREGREAARALLREEFPLDAPSGAGGRRDERMLRCLSKSSFDGRTFRRAPAAQPAGLAAAAGLDAATLSRLRANWESYYDARFQAAPAMAVWDEHRMAHRFRLGAGGGSDARLSLVAAGYSGGALGWHDFDLDTAASKDAARATPASARSTLIPTRIAYSGMPAHRFWDFEDGAVFFGGLALERTDLGQLVLTEFATVYGNDWFMLPLTVPTGSLTRITELRVKDTFGEVTEVPACAVRDGPDRAWRFFELTGDPSAEAGQAPWLFVPRAVVGGESARPSERVTLVRDQMANLAWGIETVVEGQAGYPLRRDQEWTRVRDALGLRAESDAARGPDEGDAWVYRLQTVVPPYWVPFLPEIRRNLPTQDLIRGRMSEWDRLGDAAERLAGAQGRLMDASKPLRIADEEVLRGGLELTRHFQSARAPDGRLIVWSSRRKRPAPKEPSSGRRTDVMERGRDG